MFFGMAFWRLQRKGSKVPSPGSISGGEKATNCPDDEDVGSGDFERSALADVEAGDVSKAKLGVLLVVSHQFW